ncbi:unnamed protein product [Closterium sp. Naga37s-1]|nr:unnamed protein product [Closterium sp. Naga37s-1]
MLHPLSRPSSPLLHAAFSPLISSLRRRLTNRHGSSGMGRCDQQQWASNILAAALEKGGLDGEAGIALAWWSQLEWPIGEELIAVCEVWYPPLSSSLTNPPTPPYSILSRLLPSPPTSLPLRRNFHPPLPSPPDPNPTRCVAPPIPIHSPAGHLPLRPAPHVTHPPQQHPA